MKKTIVVMMFVIMPMLSYAADQPAAHDSVQMTYAQAKSLLAGLTALDGAQKVVTEGGQEHIVTTPYQLSGLTRGAIAYDEVSLQAIVDKENAELRVFARSIGATAATKNDSPEGMQFLTKQTDDGDKVVTVDLILLSQDELKLDVNAIPPSVLAAFDRATKKDAAK